MIWMEFLYGAYIGGFPVGGRRRRTLWWPDELKARLGLKCLCRALR